MSEERLTFTDKGWFLLVAGDKCEIVNISKHGYGIVSPRYWARNIIQEAELVGPSAEVNTALEQAYVNPFKLEVKWGTEVVEGRYRHGTEIKSLNSRQLELIFNLFSESLITTTEKETG